MALPTHWTLNTGACIPTVGFGTWQAAPNEVEHAVETPFVQDTGISTAQPSTGMKLSAFNGASGKWFPLRENGLFDLASIDPAETYKAMERLLSTGKVRAIGVSNFTINRLTDPMSKTTVVPAVNQIEAHPYLQQKDLFDSCREKNILIEAYSPLGNNKTGEPRTVNDPLVGKIRERLGMDGGQLLASWGVQRGSVALPKSVTPHRIKSNIQIKILPEDAFGELNGLERHKRFNVQSRWGFDIFEELGKKVESIAKDLAQENLTKFTV